MLEKINMITSVSFAAAGAAKFNKWFADVAREGVRMEVVAMEACDAFADLVATEQSLVYELGQRYTTTGRPELLRMDVATDIEIEMGADE